MEQWRKRARVLDADGGKIAHIRYMAFDAAGSKAFLYVGVLEVMEAFGKIGMSDGNGKVRVEPEYMARIEGAAGVSAGAVAALCLALGLSSRHLHEAYLRMMEVQHQKIPFSQLLMGRQEGMLSSRTLDPCVAYLLEAAGVPYDVTFAELHARDCLHACGGFILNVSSYNQARQTPCFYNWRRSPHKSVLDAVVESMCVPLLFCPRTYAPSAHKTAPSTDSHLHGGEFIDGWFAGLFFDGFDDDAMMIVYNITEAGSRALRDTNGGGVDSSENTASTSTPSKVGADADDDDDEDREEEDDDVKSATKKGDGEVRDVQENHNVFASLLKWYAALQLRMTRLTNAQLSVSADANKLEIKWDENFITAGSTAAKRESMVHAGGLALLHKCMRPEALLGRMANVFTAIARRKSDITREMREKESCDEDEDDEERKGGEKD